MADIVFTADEEEGHLIASFGLAKQLRRRGHQVTYIGLQRAETLICNEGFPFVPIVGTSPGRAQRERDRQVELSGRAQYCDLFFERRSGFDTLMRSMRPDAMVMAPDLALEGLLMYLTYQVPIAFLRPTYFQLPRRERIIRATWTVLQESYHIDRVLALCRERKVRVRGVADLAYLIEGFPELVTLPEGFEKWHTLTEKNTFYIGPACDLGRYEERFEWEKVDKATPLILCTLGSQCYREKQRSMRLFQVIIDAAAQCPEWQFMISLGANLSVQQFRHGTNVIMRNWLPHLQILDRASIALTHAGIGTVRECIAKSTPMLLVPLMRDQFACAEAVVKHGLGMSADIDMIQPEQAIRLMKGLLADPAFAQRVAAMRESCEECDDKCLGAQVVEKIVQRKSGV